MEFWNSRHGFMFGIVLCAGLPLTAVPTGATVIVIHPFESISSGLASAGDFDTVLVAPGEYEEEVRFPDRPLTLASLTDDPATTILLTSWGPLSIYRSRSGVQRVRGFTLRGGGALATDFDWAPVGELVFENNRFEGGEYQLLEDLAGRVTFRNCLFDGNTCGAGSTSSLIFLLGVNRFEQCTFVNNSSTVGGAGGHGGLIRTGVPAAGGFNILVLLGCVFRGNSTSGKGAVVYADVTSVVEISGCLFEDNRAGVAGGALYLGDTRAEIHDNVFIGNQAPSASAIRVTGVGYNTLERNTIVAGAGPESEVVRVESSIATVRLYNNIVAYSRGAAVSWGGGPGTLTCNDFYANAGGAVTGAPPSGMTNFEIDPRFCSRATRDLHLAADSPCLDPVALCGGSDRVGALGAGCVAVPVRAVTWGRLKAMFGVVEPRN